MRIKFTETANKQFDALPPEIQKKTERQLGHLLKNIRHPSLKAKKYKGHDDIWQARIDRTWRLYFHIVEPHYIVVSIIAHPK